MIAVKRLQSLFWVLLVAFGALSAYLVSLRVATERNKLNDIRAQIAQARGDIRYLETEFSARANMRQLEQWNAESYRYATLTSGHYLDGERALAQLDKIQPNGPAYVAPPVMVAMVEGQGDLPSAAGSDSVSPAATQIRGNVSVIRTAAVVEDRREATPVKLASAQPATPSANLKVALPAAKSRDANDGALARRTERMAMLDARLLDDGTLGELGRRAAAEKRGIGQ